MLYDESEGLVATTTTDATGDYLFDRLIPGDYRLEVTRPAAYDLFSPTGQGGDGAADSDTDAGGAMAATTLASGEADMTWDSGMFKYAALGDTVWEDLNGNGIQDDGEAGIPGIAVNLYDGSGALKGTTTTSETGLYQFGNLIPGDYQVEVLRGAYDAFTARDQGTNDAVDSDMDIGTGRTVVTTLFSGENDLSWDAGLFNYASIGDTVWEDLDADGIQDPGEPTIPGVELTLYDANGHPVATTMTDANGHYLFDGLVPGEYSVGASKGGSSVQAVQQRTAGLYAAAKKPGGYDLFSPGHRGGDDTLDSDVDASGMMEPTMLISGETDPTWDAGLFQYALVGDYVWSDKNGNGIQDSSENGVADIIVNLYLADGTPAGTTTTDATGLYLFDELLPGDYYLEFLSSEGGPLPFTLQDYGPDDTVDSDVDPLTGRTTVFTLVSGDEATNWDAGIAVPEPTTAALIGLGLLGIQVAASRRGCRCF
jgi:hypothetical protein